MGWLDKLLGRTKEAGQEATEQASAGAEQVQEKASDLTGSASGEGEQFGQEARDQAGDVAQEAEERRPDNPA
jgi:hypothetical protein